jgi:superfamily II DNA or RNA helicase
MMPVLKPLQVDWVDRIRAAAARARVIVCQAATGFGKNTVAAYLAYCAFGKGKRVLMLVHRRKLVDQLGERLEQFGVPYGVLMRGEKYHPSLPVQTASRDTVLSRGLRNEFIELPPADLVMVDEAHHAHDPESEYRKILAHYPQAKILLLSATPVGPDGSGMGPFAQAIVCAAPTTQLIREGYLVGLRCYAPDRKRKGNKFLRGVYGGLVESWQSYAEGRPTVLFVTRVQHSLDAAQAFNDAGIRAAHMDADTTDDERETIFEDIGSGKIKVLCNVGIIGEGVDVPELSCCQLYCEIGGRTGLLQRVGRVMRSHPGKDHGILIDHGGSVFRHGFPDEDTEWPLAGNADEDFKEKHDDGKTEPVLYCKHCEIVYHGDNGCPQCGKMPTKPPKSIFAPPPIDAANQLLVEADRLAGRGDFSRDQKMNTWWAALATAKKRNGSIGMARQIYHRKYQEYPPDDFPLCQHRWNTPVSAAAPNLGKRRA